MKKKIIYPLFVAAIAVGCVPAKKFNALEQEHQNLQQKNNSLEQNLADCQEAKKKTDNAYTLLKEDFAQTRQAKDSLEQNLESLRSNFENLQNSYDALEKNSSSALAENSKRNRELLADLEEKKNALNKKENRLNKLEKDLQARSQRVTELEKIIAAKDAKMRKLKTSISRALTDFEGKGLTVEQRNGKVYVSMENKLLFSSGSWAVGTEGRLAVNQLGSVLAQNPDINVLIEGHTDNVPYGGSGVLKDNWDLSTKRATAIVHLLQANSNINPQRLTAAGRGEYAPIASNKTAQGKAKNRRIEVILTPKLEEVNQLLKGI